MGSAVSLEKPNKSIAEGMIRRFPSHPCREMRGSASLKCSFENINKKVGWGRIDHELGHNL